MMWSLMKGAGMVKDRRAFYVRGAGLQRDLPSRPRLHRSDAFRKKGAADPADGAVAASGGAVFAPVENDLEVEFVPPFTGEGALQVFFGFDDVFPGGQFPSLGEAVDVGIDGKGGDAKGLAHHDRGGFVADAGKGLEGRKVGGDLPRMLCDDDF